MEILDLFVAPTVPQRGAEEEEINPPVWQVGTTPKWFGFWTIGANSVLQQLFKSWMTPVTLKCLGIANDSDTM